MDELIEEFLAALSAEKQCSPHTVVAYRNDLLQLMVHLQGEGITTWREVVPEHVMAYVQYLRERQYASSTIARKTAAMKSFFLHLRAVGQAPSDFTSVLAAPRVDRYVPYAISTDEIARLLAAPARTKTPEGLRDAAMLELLYATGMRVSELVALGQRDLDVGQGVVRCQGRADRERSLPVVGNAADALMRYLLQGRPALARAHNADPDALFLNHRGQRLTRQGFWLILKGYAETAAVRNVTPHTLRHTFAAHALKTGRQLREVQTTLGHVSISTTQVYQRNPPAIAGGASSLSTAPSRLPAESRPARVVPLPRSAPASVSAIAPPVDLSADAGLKS